MSEQINEVELPPGALELENADYEKFCLEYIKTNSVAEAGRVVGWAKRQNSHKIYLRPEVQERIKYLKSEMLAELGLDTFYVLKNLKSVAERCMQAEEVLDREGNPVFIQGPDGEYAPQYKFDQAGANKSLELIGKHVGMFNDKVEHTGKNGGPIQTVNTTITLDEFKKAREDILNDY